MLSGAESSSAGGARGALKKCEANTDELWQLLCK